MIDMLRAVVAAAYRSLAANGLVVAAQGNVSAGDAASGVLVVTGTGLVAAEATADAISVVELDTGRHRDGPAPSSELASHLALIRAGHGAVVHSHAPYATALGLVRDHVAVVTAEQVAAVGGAVPVIRYQPPGSEAMAEALVDALGASVSACVIRHHGLVSVGPDVTRALNATVAAEEAARLVILASMLGPPAVLGDAEAAARGDANPA